VHEFVRDNLLCRFRRARCPGGVRGRCRVPDARQVPGHCHDFGPVGIGNFKSLATSGALGSRLEVLQIAQLQLPIALQRSRDDAVVRVHRFVSTLSELRLIASTSARTGAEGPRVRGRNAHNRAATPAVSRISCRNHYPLVGQQQTPRRWARGRWGGRQQPHGPTTKADQHLPPWARKPPPQNETPMARHEPFIAAFTLYDCGWMALPTTSMSSPNTAPSMSQLPSSTTR
jgi:hypothetical protein